MHEFALPSLNAGRNPDLADRYSSSRTADISWASARPCHSVAGGARWSSKLTLRAQRSVRRTRELGIHRSAVLHDQVSYT